MLIKFLLQPASLVFPGSSSHGGDVAACVIDINQTTLPTPFYSVLASILVFVAPSTVILPTILRFLLCSSGPISALLVNSTVYLFMKVSLMGLRDILDRGILADLLI